MHREEEELLGTCLDCGATLAPGPDPAFAFGDRGVLCFDCSIRRGGSYDANRDCWLEEPSLEGFAGEFE